MKKLLIITFIFLCFRESLLSQTITQTVKGKVIDQTTQEALFGATISLVDSNPVLGTITNEEGAFILNEVPVGRQSFEFRMIGYKTFFVTEILVSSGKEVVLNVSLEEEATVLNEIVITNRVDKDRPINKLSSVSSRQFTVEETQRYAGGLNDPARLVSSFAGVATPSVSSNGISVRGNSPSGLLWRIEDVEIPSPNHFANLTIAGAGALTVLSNQVMGNSDFYTGAFPAEYGNATSGVFDINLRSGNSTEREHTAQIGILGLEFASEGPFKKDKTATYLFNYRYSTLALIGSLLPDDAGILKYQDLSFKIKIPTKNAETFSIWGLGAYDSVDSQAEEMENWESIGDRENSQTSLYMFATSVNHKTSLNSKSVLNTTLAFSGNGMKFKEQYLDDNLLEHPQSDAKKNSYKLTLQSNLNSYLSERHYNRTGFYINSIGYNLDINDAEMPKSSLTNIVDEKGQSFQFQLYSQSRFQLSPKLTLNAGFYSQYFQLNEEFSFEPRASVSYKLNERSSLSFAYGLHSKIEPLEVYFVKNDLGNEPNKDLKLMKSNHLVLSFNSKINDNLRLSIEPYYQHLKNVPVSPDSYISTINVEDNLFFNHELVNSGTGRNIGIDFTLERYLKKGMYYLLTASVFDSKYTANDGIERNTRYNKNYVLNALIGKEWQVGKTKNNILSANVRFNYLDGNRAEAIDEASSLMSQDVAYGETNGELSFKDKFKATPITSFTISYRKNKPKFSSVWSLQVLNSNNTEEFDKNIFNINTQTVEQKYKAVMIPNLSYKIEF